MSRNRCSTPMWRKRLRQRTWLIFAGGMIASPYWSASAFSNLGLDWTTCEMTSCHSSIIRSRPSSTLFAQEAGNGNNLMHDIPKERCVLPSDRTAYREIKHTLISLLQKRDYEGARKVSTGMFEFLNEEAELSGSERAELSAAVDDALQAVYSSSFAPPYRGYSSIARISLGVDLLFSQLTSSLVPPHNSVPKPFLLSALQALTGLNEVKSINTFGGKLNNTDAAYRILQRLVTGVGVRNFNARTKNRLYEKDFNLVLNAYSNVGRMDMAHRIMALQERTPNAPPLSPVAFSILFKGYGKLGDIYNIDMLLGHADASGIEADTIMLNSLIDAYVNCKELERAMDIFNFMRKPSVGSVPATEYPVLFRPDRCPVPNKRTYNTMLKGLANRGRYHDARSLADEMERRDLWDHVTTNTLVQAAVKGSDFDTAEQLLEKYTVVGDHTADSHPNSEAYTTVVDGYARFGDMSKAARVLQSMKARGVEPNEYTYTCLIGALASRKKVDQALKLIIYMKSVGIKPRVVTYNAFISGLTQRDRTIDGRLYDMYVDETIKMLKTMMSNGIKPNTVTICALVEAFGKCDNPRISEAVALVDKFEKDGIIPQKNKIISTALIHALGAAGEIDGATKRFREIAKPDTAAVNALLDVYVKHDRNESALEIFDEYFQGANSKLRPDVVSFSIVITYALKGVASSGCKHVRKLYEEMKYRRRIRPDNAVVDVILKSIIEYGKNGNLLASDVRFVAQVLRDAETLDWSEGQLERRKRAVQTIMTGRIAGTWEEESDLYGLTNADDYEDELFKKHGWNKVDSGFRLWGATLRRDDRRTRQSDQFLQSKGWNDVDSGFRII